MIETFNFVLFWCSIDLIKREKNMSISGTYHFRNCKYTHMNQNNSLDQSKLMVAIGLSDSMESSSDDIIPMQRRKKRGFSRKRFHCIMSIEKIFNFVLIEMPEYHQHRPIFLNPVMLLDYGHY